MTFALVCCILGLIGNYLAEANVNVNIENDNVDLSIGTIINYPGRLGAVYLKNLEGRLDEFKWTYKRDGDIMVPASYFETRIKDAAQSHFTLNRAGAIAGLINLAQNDASKACDALMEYYGFLHVTHPHLMNEKNTARSAQDPRLYTEEMLLTMSKLTPELDVTDSLKVKENLDKAIAIVNSRSTVTCKIPLVWKDVIIDSYKKIHADILRKLREIKTILDPEIKFEADGVKGIRAFGVKHVAGACDYFFAHSKEYKINLEGTTHEAVKNNIKNYSKDSSLSGLPHLFHSVKYVPSEACDAFFRYGRILMVNKGTLETELENASEGKRKMSADAYWMLKRLTTTNATTHHQLMGIVTDAKNLFRSKYYTCRSNGIYRDAVIDAYKFIQDEVERTLLVFESHLEQLKKDLPNATYP